LGTSTVENGKAASTEVGDTFPLQTLQIYEEKRSRKFDHGSLFIIFLLLEKLSRCLWFGCHLAGS